MAARQQDLHCLLMLWGQATPGATLLQEMLIVALARLKGACCCRLPQVPCCQPSAPACLSSACRVTPLNAAAASSSGTGKQQQPPVARAVFGDGQLDADAGAVGNMAEGAAAGTAQGVMQTAGAGMSSVEQLGLSAEVT